MSALGTPRSPRALRALRALRASAPVAVLALVAACTVPNSVDVNCGDDGACPGNFVCAFGLCVDPSDQRLSTVDVEVLDPSGTAPIQSVRVDLRASPRVDVELKPGVIVTGSVVRDEAGVTGATVLARPTESIEGRAIAPIATTDDAGDFALVCVEGEDYALTVSSTEPLVPPLYVDEPFRAEGDELDLDELTLSRGEYVVRGRVITSDGVATLPVRAMDVKLRRETRDVSSSALTGDDGTFEIALRGEDRGLDLVLEIAPTTDSAASPRITQSVAVVALQTDLGDIDLGVLGPQRVEARVLDAAQQPVAGAVAYVSGPLGNGTFSGEFSSDEAGIVRLDLPPADTYAVVVVGPEGSAGGLLLVEDMVVPSENDLVWNLPPRVQYAGSVLDPEGAALANATLSVVRIPDSQGDARSQLIDEILGDALVAFELTSSDRGAFAVALDPGKYRVSTRPALGANLPANSELVVVPPEGLTQDVVLPQRAFVAGTVLFDGAAVGNAFIRVFSGVANERREAILLGEGLADAAGAFEIVVPNVVTSVANPDPP